MIAGLKWLNERSGVKNWDAGGDGDQDSEKHLKNVLGCKTKKYLLKT